MKNFWHVFFFFWRHMTPPGEYFISWQFFLPGAAILLTRRMLSANRLLFIFRKTSRVPFSAEFNGFINSFSGSLAFPLAVNFNFAAATISRSICWRKYFFNFSCSIAENYSSACCTKNFCKLPKFRRKLLLEIEKDKMQFFNGSARE